MSKTDTGTAGFFPAAVVWDLDGTLVDSAADLATALNALLVEQGQQTHAVEKVRPMIGHGVAKLVERGFRAAGASLDPETADAIYIEPIHWRFVEEIIAKEKPDVLLPTMGGQTALNLAMDLYNSGALDERGIELIGAKAEPIETAENRARFSLSQQCHCL